jgi:hypothetical protein
MPPQVAPVPVKQFLDFWLFNGKSLKPKHAPVPRQEHVEDPACAGAGVPLAGIAGAINACAEITEAYQPGSRMQFYYVDNVKEVTFQVKK